MTQEEAICLAARIGMPQGDEPWTLLRQGDATWWICTRVPDRQESMLTTVSIRDGAVGYQSTPSCPPDQGLLIRAGLTLVGSLPPPTRYLKSPPIQTVCGIRPSRTLANDDALCLARVVAGDMPVVGWRLEENPDSWRVVGTIRDSPPCVGEWYEVTVTKVGGSVRSALHSFLSCIFCSGRPDTGAKVGSVDNPPGQGRASPERLR